ncbi:MAG: EAL domain-containing protein [Planctomycetaceae bacterium]|nr:EAL domain-containing protein [Planctomycetaceae bacterium]
MDSETFSPRSLPLGPMLMNNKPSKRRSLVGYPKESRNLKSSGSGSLFAREVVGGWLLEGESNGNGEPDQVVVTTSPFRIGRRSSNNLSISNRTVSGHHAELIYKDEKLLLKDYRSTNGTFVNGRRVLGLETLNEGDVIHFGKVRFNVRRNQGVVSRATLAFDAEGDALAHLQFASLWDGQGLNPHFQPIVRMSDRATVGFEALARSTLVGLENPYTMFQVAKQHKAEAELSTLLRQVSLEKAYPFLENHALYINTHPKEMGQVELLDSLEELRVEFPLASIILEVHEEGSVSIKFLEELKAKLVDLDMKLAYDDFGRGQSRLNALAEVTPDIVKFDMELVRGLHKASSKRRRLIRSLLKIVKALNGVTLAEGVEEEAEAEVCQDLGFELAQGYYYGRPAPVEHWKGEKEPWESTHPLAHK